MRHNYICIKSRHLHVNIIKDRIQESKDAPTFRHIRSLLELFFVSVVTNSDIQTNSASADNLLKVPAVEEHTLPPPPNNLRTEKGQAVFSNLVLPAAPPMYRPYLNQDEEEKNKKGKSYVNAGLTTR